MTQIRSSKDKESEKLKKTDDLQCKAIKQKFSELFPLREVYLIATNELEEKAILNALDELEDAHCKEIANADIRKQGIADEWQSERVAKVRDELAFADDAELLRTPFPKDDSDNDALHHDAANVSSISLKGEDNTWIDPLTAPPCWVQATVVAIVRDEGPQSSASAMQIFSPPLLRAVRLRLLGSARDGDSITNGDYADVALPRYFPSAAYGLHPSDDPWHEMKKRRRQHREGLDRAEKARSYFQQLEWATAATDDDLEPLCAHVKQLDAFLSDRRSEIALSAPFWGQEQQDDDRIATSHAYDWLNVQPNGGQPMNTGFKKYVAAIPRRCCSDVDILMLGAASIAKALQQPTLSKIETRATARNDAKHFKERRWLTFLTTPPRPPPPRPPLSLAQQKLALRATKNPAFMNNIDGPTSAAELTTTANPFTKGSPGAFDLLSV